MNLNYYFSLLQLNKSYLQRYSCKKLYLPLFDPRPLPPPAALFDEDELVILVDDETLEELDDPDLLLRRNSPEKYPALRDSIKVVFPTPLWPNTFILIFGIGEVEGISCSM